MAPPFAQQTKKTTTQSSTSGGPPGLTSSRRAGPPAPSGKSGTEILKDLNREITRKTYFDGRQDISDDRLDRRAKQAQELKDFKEQYTKPVYTESGSVVKGLTQAKDATYFDTDSSSPTFGQYVTTTLADKEMQLANKYGPTFGEIMSDVTYAGGKVLGAVGERAMSGSLGIFGALKDVANYALDKANKGYEKLNSVQQEIFDNPDKYPYASKVPQVEAVNNSRQLALEADKDALGLELDALLAEREAENRFRYDNPTVDMRSPTREKLDPIDIDGSYVESGQFKEDLQKSGIITVDVPDTQEPLPDSTKIPGYNNVTIGMLKEDLKKRNFNDFQITGIINEMTQRIISGEDVNAPYESMEEPENVEQNNIQIKDGEATPITDEEFKEKEKKVNEIFEGDDFFSQSLPTNNGTQVTDYNNPGNLQFAGQQGAIEGQTYGNNFAVFPDAETGLNALKKDLTAKVNRSNKVEDIIGQYAPKEDNPQSFNNYVSFVKNTVGETVEPNEIDDLTRSVIQFENKPDIANQYLTMVADGGMIDKQLKSLQNGLQNMYNGIPSVKRR